MPYKQLVLPDMSIQEQTGWCLKFTERSFKTPALYATAWQGWQSAQFKHEGRNFPTGVAFPVWFNWWGDLGNGLGKVQYGHVAFVYTDGKVYSAPLSGYGRASFDSVDALARAFGGGMTYAGWSEDLAGIKVIEGEDMTSSETPVDELVVRLGYNLAGIRQPSDQEIKDRLAEGWKTGDYLRFMLESAEHQNVAKAYGTYITSQDSAVNRAAVLDYVSKNLK